MGALLRIVVVASATSVSHTGTGIEVVLGTCEVVFKHKLSQVCPYRYRFTEPTQSMVGTQDPRLLVGPGHAVNLMLSLQVLGLSCNGRRTILQLGLSHFRCLRDKQMFGWTSLFDRLQIQLFRILCRSVRMAVLVPHRARSLSIRTSIRPTIKTCKQGCQILGTSRLL